MKDEQQRLTIIIQQGWQLQETNLPRQIPEAPDNGELSQAPAVANRQPEANPTQQPQLASTAVSMQWLDGKRKNLRSRFGQVERSQGRGMAARGCGRWWGGGLAWAMVKVARQQSSRDKRKLLRAPLARGARWSQIYGVRTFWSGCR